jgi:hypothetical protein
VEGNVVKAAEVIKEATAAGVRIASEGDGLLLEATAAPAKAMIALITQHKAEIIDLLRAGRGGPAGAEVSWLDMVVAVENEAGRHRIWCDELKHLSWCDRFIDLQASHCAGRKLDADPATDSLDRFNQSRKALAGVYRHLADSLHEASLEERLGRP